MNYNHNHIQDIRDLTLPDRYHLSVLLGGKSGHGFYLYYFNELKLNIHRTQHECFNHVNSLYFEIFGEWRYEAYDSFSRQYHKHFLNKKQ